MSGLWAEFAGREAGPVVQFIKYALCGGLATAVDMAVFFFMAWRILPGLRETDPLVVRLHLRVRPVDESLRAFRFLVNTAVAFVFSNLTAYALNAAWVFTPGRHGRGVEMALFFAVSAASVAIGAAVGWALIRWAGWSTSISYGSKLVASLLVNYAGRKWFVFLG